MKIGKVPVNVLKRSILRELEANHCKQDEVIKGAEVGADNALLRLKIHDDTVINTQSYEADSELGAAMAVHKAVNNLFTANAVPVAITVALMLPVDFKEECLKSYMNSMVKTANRLQVSIVGGDTKTVASVTVPIVTVTAIGSVCERELLGKASPGQELVVSKWIGMEGALLLANGREEELLKRYPYAMIQAVKDLEDEISVGKEAQVAAKAGVAAMHDLSESGILGALWEFAEYHQVGLNVDLKKIPVMQEIIEICEYYDLNPYGLRSAGALLMATEKGNTLVEKLAEQGIPAAVIGRVTEENQRIIMNEEEVRYLDRPLPDEIYKVRKESV